MMMPVPIVVTVLTYVVYVISAGSAALAFYYAARNLKADLVLLGASVATLAAWSLESVVLLVMDLSIPIGPDPVMLYGYLVTGFALVLGGGWLGVFERSRWGSLVIGIANATMIVMQMRVLQIWAEVAA